MKIDVTLKVSTADVPARRIYPFIGIMKGGAWTLLLAWCPKRHQLKATFQKRFGYYHISSLGFNFSVSLHF